MRVMKWGNSLGIRIPMTLAKKLSLTEGTPIDYQVENDALIIRRKEYSLEDLLSRIKTENIHKEVDTDKPVGREVW